MLVDFNEMDSLNIASSLTVLCQASQYNTGMPIRAYILCVIKKSQSVLTHVM